MPRSPICGYDIAGLPHDTCPECGCNVPVERAKMEPKPSPATIIVPLAIAAPMWLMSGLVVGSLMFSRADMSAMAYVWSSAIVLTAVVVPAGLISSVLARRRVQVMNWAAYQLLVAGSWLQLALAFGVWSLIFVR